MVKKGFVNIHEFKDFGHDLRSEHLNKAMSSRRATEAYMNESRFNKLIRVQALVGAQTYVPQRDRTRTLCNQSCDGLYSQQSLDAKRQVLRVSTGLSGKVALFIHGGGIMQQVDDRLNQMNTSARRAINTPWAGVKLVTHMIRTQISP